MLRALLLAVGLSLLAAQTLAQEESQDEMIRGSCEGVSNWARTAMKYRQEGAPMATGMKATQDMSTRMTANISADSPLQSIIPLYTESVIEAYDSPRWNGQKHIDRSIEEHRDKYFLACYKILAGS